MDAEVVVVGEIESDESGIRLDTDRAGPRDVDSVEVDRVLSWDEKW